MRAPEKRSRQVQVSLSRSTGRHSESARLLSRVENSEEGRSEGEMPVREYCCEIYIPSSEGVRPGEKVRTPGW